jgi:hypothetical protein
MQIFSSDELCESEISDRLIAAVQRGIQALARMH